MREIFDNILNSDNLFIQFVLDIVFNFSEYKISDKAASMTYYLALCIGPFMMVLLWLAESFLKANPQWLKMFLGQYLESPDIIVNPLITYLNTTDGIWVTLVAVGIALFSASNAITNLIRYMDEILGTENGNGIVSTVKNKVMAIFFTLLFIISIVLFLSTVVYGDPIVRAVKYMTHIDLNEYKIWDMINTLLPIGYLFVVMLALYKLVPSNSMKDLSIQEVSVAALFSTVGWIIASQVFSIYVNNFNSKNAIYGVLGNFMVLLLWFYILMMIILIGTIVLDIYRRDYKYRIKENK